jgi:hypothetical protein
LKQRDKEGDMTRSKIAFIAVVVVLVGTIIYQMVKPQVVSIKSVTFTGCAPGLDRTQLPDGGEFCSTENRIVTVSWGPQAERRAVRLDEEMQA